MMKKEVTFIGAFLLLVNATAWAHGGVSIEEDKCVLKIGNYLVHFTGYQPESGGSEEFCEDIPSTGHAIIVMDFVDPQLRKMDTSLRIVQTNSWSEAKAYTLGEEAKEITYLPPQKYQSGSIRFDHRFAEPGYFVGIMTAASDVGQLGSLFPFSIGYGIGTFSGGAGGRNQLLVIFAAVAITGGALLYYASRRKAQRTFRLN